VAAARVCENLQSHSWSNDFLLQAMVRCAQDVFKGQGQGTSIFSVYLHRPIFFGSAPLSPNYFNKFKLWSQKDFDVHGASPELPRIFQTKLGSATDAVHEHNSGLEIPDSSFFPFKFKETDFRKHNTLNCAKF
jgi:hypothetical protein